MAQASVGWRTMTGQRLTSASYWPEICVEAETSADPAGENGIDRVEFVVTDASGSTTISTSRGVRVPNHSRFNSPLIDDPDAPDGLVRPGKMTPIEGYGFRLNPSDYDPGTITITATAYSGLGTATPLPWPVVLYNDTDGTDRRPSKKRIFVSPSGNDANPGTESQPVKEIQTAVGLCRANPAGSSLADRDCGGAEVVVMAGTHLTRNFFPSPTIHTSGDYWLTFTFEEGSIVERANLGGTGPFLSFASAGAGTKQRIRWNGAVVRGLGPVLNVSTSVITEWWFDGCTKHSAYFTEDGPIPRVSARYLEDTQTLFGKISPTSSNARMFYTCCVAQGAVGGFSEFQLAQDCKVSEFVGIALETFDLGSGGGQSSNVLIDGQRAYKDLKGRVRGTINGCTITVPSASRMRIDQNGPLVFASEGDSKPMDLSTLAEIAGVDHFRIKCTGLASGNNGEFRVISAGVGSGGFGYAILDNPTAVAQTAGSGSLAETSVYVNQSAGVGNCSFTAGTTTVSRPSGSFVDDGYAVGDVVRMEWLALTRKATVASVGISTLGLYLGLGQTWPTSETGVSVSRGYWEPDIVHPDVIFFGGSAQTNSMTSGVCTRDLDNAQTYFNPSPTLTRSSFCNNRDGGNKPLNANLAGGNRVDYVFHNNTISGALQLGGTQTRMSFVNNVAGTLSGLQSGGYCVRNHVVSGGAPGFGSGWTTGAWFATNVLASPWFLNPLPQWLGTGSSAAPHLPETWWIGATGTTPGCWRLSGWFNWSFTTSPGNSDASAVASGTLPLSGSAVGLLQSLAQASGTISLTGSAAATLGVLALSAGDLDLTGAAAADIGVVAQASGSISLTGTAAANAGISGDTAGDLPITGTAAATFGLVADASGSIDLAGTADALLGVTADCAGDLPIAGAGTGNMPDVEVVASASSELPLTGLAEADVGILALCTGNLLLVGAAVAESGVVASCVGTLTLTGSASSLAVAAPAPPPAARKNKAPPPWRVPAHRRPERTWRP